LGRYFFTGAACAGAGALCCAGAGAGAFEAGTCCAGAVFAGADFVVFGSNTVAPSPAFRVAIMEIDIDVIMKSTAEMVVAFESNVAEPRGPKAVCEPIPPNAPARSAALPLCSNTTIIRKMQTNMWIVNKR